ncbi:MAG: UDP-N-acetylmuramoyl-L-alanine--D-glutamate ligase [Hyphomicrobiales bacterium]|nr:UDP-N-acetylmuramoyl-L-alanine--D-glutamate ligase [Hyphomicrobiales bacterium]
MLAPGSYKNKKVCVFGLGRSGCASALALQEVGASVVGWDDVAERRQHAESIGITLEETLKGDILLPAPGVPLTHPQPHPVITRARDNGMEIVGDIELFQQVLNEQNAGAEWIAITGTNGKTTTAALATHMLEQANFEVALGGNIGTPAMSLPPPRRKLVYVLEVSSFQIALTRSLAPNIAIQLNITPDHIDRHGTLQEYAAVKARLFARLGRGRGKSVAIIGVDDAPGRALFEKLHSQKNIRIIALALEEANLPPTLGSVRVQNAKLMDNIKPAERGCYDIEGVTSLIGKHNYQNIAAAFAIGRVYGLPGAQILKCFNGFKPPQHRMEQIASISAVTFVNDSKATNANAAARSLECFDKIHWIVGGIPKAEGIKPLRTFFPKVKQAYIIGTAQEEFASLFKECGVPHNCYGNLRDAVVNAASNANAGDVVLLAPACASFDQFADFEARGDAFRDIVERLAQ